MSGQILRSSAATHLRSGGSFNIIFISSSFKNTTMKAMYLTTDVKDNLCTGISDLPAYD